MAWLADTNVLVYRYDRRFPAKQARATELLREGIARGEARISQQSVSEFVAATTRAAPRGGPPLLSLGEALREAEELLAQFDVLFPTEAQLRLAIRGTLTYGFSWWDAQIWACAEHHGLSTLYSEDFQADRLYGAVRVVNPFEA